MLLKIITVKNAWFVTIGFSIIGSNLKILYIMVAMIWQCCFLIGKIAIITAKDVDYCCIIHGISKSEAIPLLGNSVLDDSGYM